MNFPAKTTLATWAASLALAAGLPSQVAGKSWHSLQSLDATILAYLRDHKVPGATISATKQGRLVFQKAYGHANVRHRVQMRPYHRSGIGSVSKILTALSAMKLQEQQANFSTYRFVYGQGGVLPESYYLSFMSFGGSSLSWGRKIRVRHLLSHTSGIRGSGDLALTSQVFGVAPTELLYGHVHLVYLLTNKLGWAPATQYEYSNHGMGVVGWIVERRSGVRYEKYVRKHILEPLGIRHVVRWGQERGIRDAAPHDYDKWGIARPLAPFAYPVNAELAAGGWAATATDLCRVMCATDRRVNVPDVLKPATLEEMETRPYPNVNPDQALGWQIASSQRSRRGVKLAHSGNVRGTSAYMTKFTKGYKSLSGIDLSDVHVAVCFNIESATGSPKELSASVARSVGQASIPFWFDLWGGQYAIQR